MTRPVCALTGGRGYVGSRIRRALALHGWQVLLLCRTPNSANADEVAWSLGKNGDTRSLLAERNVRALVHAAWDFSVLDPHEYRRINVEGTQHLLRSAKEAGVSQSIFISTISAFEGARSLYGRAKLEAEKIAAAYGALAIRPGLVYGSRSGGVYGAMSKTVAKGGLVPLIGSGRYPQYLVHEEDLCSAITQACEGAWQAEIGTPITIANSAVWQFRDLLQAIAKIENKQIRLLSVPWMGVYAGLKLAEAIKIRIGFRSDSVLSLVNQNPAPDFSPLQRLGIAPRPFPQGVA